MDSEPAGSETRGGRMKISNLTSSKRAEAQGGAADAALIYQGLQTDGLRLGSAHYTICCVWAHINSSQFSKVVICF